MDKNIEIDINLKLIFRIIGIEIKIDY